MPHPVLLPQEHAARGRPPARATGALAHPRLRPVVLVFVRATMLERCATRARYSPQRSGTPRGPGRARRSCSTCSAGCRGAGPGSQGIGPVVPPDSSARSSRRALGAGPSPASLSGRQARRPRRRPLAFGRRAALVCAQPSCDRARVRRSRLRRAAARAGGQGCTTATEHPTRRVVEQGPRPDPSASAGGVGRVHRQQFEKRILSGETMGFTSSSTSYGACRARRWWRRGGGAAADATGRSGRRPPAACSLVVFAVGSRTAVRRGLGVAYRGDRTIAGWLRVTPGWPMSPGSAGFPRRPRPSGTAPSAPCSTPASPAGATGRPRPKSPAHPSLGVGCRTSGRTTAVRPAASERTRTI